MAKEQKAYLIKHVIPSNDGNFWGPRGNQTNPSDDTDIVLCTGLHASGYWYFEPLIPGQSWGYIRHAGGKYVHPYGGPMNPPDGRRLVLYRKEEGFNKEYCEFEYDAKNQVFKHVSGKYVHTESDVVEPEAGTRLVFREGFTSRSKFELVEVPTKNK